MEWSKTTLRKEIETEENMTEIANERYKHTTKLEYALETNVKVTHMFVGRMARERNQFRNETSARNLGSDGNLEQDRQNNLHPQEVCIMINDSITDSVDADGETEATGDNNVSSETPDSPVHFDENLDSFVSDLTSSHNNIQNINEVDHISINTDDANNILKNPASSINVYEIDEASKIPDKQVITGNKNYGMQENLTETEIKTESNGHHPCFANSPINEESLLKWGSEEIVSSESDIFKSLGFSACVDANNDCNDNKKDKNRLKRHQKENIPMAKKRNVENNLKSYCSYFPYLKKEENVSGTFEDTAGKSVTDLITYFETLNILNKSSAELPNRKKLKAQSTAPKNDLKNKHFTKLRFIHEKDAECSSNSPLSDTEISKYNINDVKCSTEKTTEVMQPDLNTLVRQNMQSTTAESDVCTSINGKRVHFEQDESRSKGDARKIKKPVFLFNDGVTKETEHSKISNPGRLDCQRKQSPTDESEIRTSKKGKHVHFEKNETRPGGKEKIKEHVFLFKDGIPNETENSKISNPRQRAVAHPPLAKLMDIEDNSALNFRMTKGESFLDNNIPNKTNIIPTVIHAKGGLYSNHRRGGGEKNRSYKKEQIASKYSPKVGLIVFIVITILTVMAFGVIYSKIPEEPSYSFFRDVFQRWMGFKKKSV